MRFYKVNIKGHFLARDSVRTIFLTFAVKIGRDLFDIVMCVQNSSFYSCEME